VERSDPKAILESREAVLQRVKENEETFEVRADRTFHYEDGSMRQYGVRVAVRKRGGRDFTVTAKEARSTKEGEDLELNGDVKLLASDGFELAVQHATYNQQQNLVTAEGDVSFLKGHLSGSSKGMTYDTSTEVLRLLADPDVLLTPDPEGGTEGMAFKAGSATLDRVQHLLSLDENASVNKGGQVLNGDTVLARLSEDEQRVTFIELHGNARVTGSEATFQELTSRDMALEYAEDGTTIQRAVLRGDAVVVLAATGEDAGHRRVSAGVLDLLFDAEGKLTRAVGSEGSRVEIPGNDAGRTQAVTGTNLLAESGPGGSLSSLRFTDDVVYQERTEQKGRGVSTRTAKARTLELRLTDDGVQSAVFGGGATFDESGLSGSARAIEYDVRAGRLVLATEPGSPDARMVDQRLSMTARRMEVGLEGHDFEAQGGVKTELRPSAAGDDGRRMPGLFAQERSVNANAERVSSSGTGGRMTYSGDAALWQGDTAVRAASIDLDREGGNLVATGAARLSLPLDKGLATGRAARLQYDDQRRRVTLDTPVATPGARGTAPGTPPAAPAAAAPSAPAPRGTASGAKPAAPPAGARGTPAPAPAASASGVPAGTQSYLSGPQGEVRADRITVDLAARSSSTERMDATGTVTLRVGGKRASSQELHYLAKDESYELVGSARAPVSVIESCRATTGKTLIFYGSTDRILVDGNEEIRTQTKGGGSCTPWAR
jgi:LPS export ABC transporter protein LptC